MEKDFVEVFSLTSIKLNTLNLIYKFKQTKHETIKECSNQLKKYTLRCPEVETPNQERLVSVILESMINKKLHVTLSPMKHKTLVASIKDAVELDDSCDEF